MLASLIALSFSLATASTALADLAGTFRHDPVLLVDANQKEVGAMTIFEERLGYRYLFASEANRKKFQANPARYEIQLGGGCGSMGSLSGRGSPDLFALHKGKIYVFASYSCRERFLKMAEDLLERDDQAPTGSEDERLRGQALAVKVVDWAGGSKAVAGLETLQIQFKETQKSGGRDYAHLNVLAIRWPDEIVQHEQWNDDIWLDVADGKTGAQISRRATLPMHPQQIRELERLRNKTFAAVLRAAIQRDAITLGRGKAESGLERLEVYCDGTSVWLEVEPSTGRVGAMEYVAIRSKRGRMRHEFTDFETVQGVRLPAAWVVKFDGKPSSNREKGQTSYRADAVGIDFKVPK